MPSATSTLVLLAHPHLRSSRINAALADAAREIPGILVHDLYANYPYGRINVEREQQLLIDHDEVVLQFPFYWYSVPPLLKQWLDEVLLVDFAYGDDGGVLHGKTLQIVTTTGGPSESYRPEGYNRFSALQLLLPLEATANLIGMHYPDPLVLHGVRTWSEQDVAAAAEAYRALLAPAKQTATAA